MNFFIFTIFLYIEVIFGTMRVVILLLMLLLLIPVAFSATIYGTIYDLSLNKADNVKVEVNTEPRQFYVSKNGSYAFNVPIGNYNVKAEQHIGNLLVSSVTENITIKDNWVYVLDLILFPKIEEELENDIEVIQIPERRFDFLPVIILLLSVAFLIYFFKRKKAVKKEVEKEYKDIKAESDLDEVIRIIKEEGGRATQKDIRKKIPLSEAKISLMIAQLESEGKIKKIKKGRGNIIILNR